MEDKILSRAMSSELGQPSYFYQLVAPSAPKKKRYCLKCHVHFVSSGYGNRLCGACAAQNRRSSLLAASFS